MYKITIVHEMLVVHRNASSLRGGCIYKRVDITAVRVLCLQKGLTEDDVLTSKHVAANHI